MAVLLCLLAFLIAAVCRHSFGDSASDLQVSIDQRPGTPFFKIEHKPKPANKP